MRLVKPPKSTLGLVTTKGHSSDGRSHHPRKSETPVNFVGVDGEGVTDKDGTHRYVLFGVGQEQISDPEGLSWQSIFSFLYAQYRPNTAYVGFFLGYDFTQILKTMPEDRARMLCTSEGVALRRHRIPGKSPHPVECDGWQFDMLGTKRLRIRPKGCTCKYSTCHHKHDPWMYICDVGPFFQTSFLSVIDPGKWLPGTEVVTPDEFATIAEGKARRAGAVLDDDMRRYNRLENEILVRVMKTLDKGFHDIGVHLPASKWFGPGQAAQAWLRKEKVPTREDHTGVVPQWFLEAARMSYVGGWFEDFCHGIIPGTSWENDVNSAYPSIIATLPCLLHGRYSHGNGLPPDNVAGKGWTLVYAKIWSPGMPKRSGLPHIGAMLHRDPHGRIFRPHATEGWFWWHELQAACRAGLVKRLDNRGRQQLERWVHYDPCDCPPPMRGVRGLYERRLQVGKESPLGKAAKTVYNSAYGKFAQSVGEPIFGNPVYASLITAGCRTLILDAIATHPDGMRAVTMVATDAVYFMSRHPTLPISSKLGEWGEVRRENLTLFKPGVYWDDKARKRIAEGLAPVFKARGFKASDLTRQLGSIDEVFSSWNGLVEGSVEFPSVSFRPSFAMVTALQALRRNSWDMAGRVTSGSTAVLLEQNSDPSDKRDGIYPDTYDGRTVWRSRPHYGMTTKAGEMQWVASTPYTKRFGMEDPWSDEYRARLGETPDGMIGDMLSWILTGE